MADRREQGQVCSPLPPTALPPPPAKLPRILGAVEKVAWGEYSSWCNAPVVLSQGSRCIRDCLLRG